MHFESHQTAPPQRKTLTKDKSDRVNKVQSTEFRSYKRDILALYSSCNEENS